ncbi:MAG: roadblock/LC7 domain-containing protein [Hamadaea sp.]|nr:roadblock/LC7 domain-containing protein [Hamadaea sp.]
MELTARPTAELAWLVDDLVSRLPGAEKAVVLSADGLLMAASSGVAREDAEHLSAVAASMFGLARGASRRFGKGPVRQAMIEMASGFLFVSSGGTGACLAVLATETADVGLMAYEMAMLVVRVGEYLSAPARANGVPARRPAVPAQAGPGE